MSDSAPPPAYTPTAPDNAVDDIDITSAFSNFTIPPSPTPTVEACLVHLKLLFAFQSLKEDIGYTDGLFGIWDSLAGPLSSETIPKKNGVDEKKGADERRDIAKEELETKMRDSTLKTLSEIREKRWALFVARAAERYRIWFKSLGGTLLREVDMIEKGSMVYEMFVEEFGSDKMAWTKDRLLPLGTSHVVPCDVAMLTTQMFS